MFAASPTTSTRLTWAKKKLSSESKSARVRPAASNLPRRARSRYFNTDAFTRNAGPGKKGQFGNAGRNIITGPGDIVTTLGTQKRFLMPMEGHAVELHSEFYDLLNRPNFGNPISNMRSPAFGRTTRAGGARVVQVALRYDF